MTYRDIPEKYFEMAGVGIGFVGPGLIGLQIQAEWTRTTPSTLSLVYLIGFLALFIFWFLYGIRFQRAAVWFGNAMGAVLQAILLTIVLLK